MMRGSSWTASLIFVGIIRIDCRSFWLLVLTFGVYLCRLLLLRVSAVRTCSSSVPKTRLSVQAYI